MFVWRKLNLMPLLTFAMLDLHVSCPENQFLLPDQVCCHFCGTDRFVTTNCTRNQGGFVTSVKCSPCTVCDNGREMIAPCTNFTNTQCSEKKVGVLLTEDEKVNTNIACAIKLLCVIVPLVCIVIIAAVGYKWCTRRREEPLKMMI